MAATVKKCRPDLDKTKTSVSKIFTDMELLNQQLLLPPTTGCSNIEYIMKTSRYTPPPHHHYRGLTIHLIQKLPTPPLT